MVLAVVLLVGGGALLIAGAEWAIRGAARFARAVGASVFLLGALLFGIDLEGLSTALLAAGRGQTAIAAGEAFGTIVLLFGVGFGLALLVARGPVPSPGTLMAGAPAATLAVAAGVLADDRVTRPEGALLVLVYAGYVGLVVREGRAIRARTAEVEREAGEGTAAGRAGLLAILGLAAVTGGAWMLVEGGVRLLAHTDLRAGFVGAAIVGTLASLDEVLLAVLPVRRGVPDLATGNLFGTVAAFSAAVLGLAALVRPVAVDGPAGLTFLAAAALYAAVAAAFMARGRGGRLLGALLLSCYAAWLAFAATL